MKFLHLADLHLGKSVNEISMLEDQKAVLGQIAEMAKSRRADAVLIAGDVYDRSVPPEEAVALLDSFLTALSEAGIKILLISGNHDSDERLNFGSRLFEKSGIFIAGRYQGRLSCVTLQDEFGPVRFWMLPFVKASVVRHFLEEDKKEENKQTSPVKTANKPRTEITDYDSAVRAAVGTATDPAWEGRWQLPEKTLDPSERNVILAHQFVTAGGSDPETAGSESVFENVGTVEKVDVSAFDAFDYAALGHIHSPQAVGRETVRYSGSPLKYSLSEIRKDKSVPLVTMGPKGDVKVELLPLHPLHEMRRLKGTLAQLTDPANILYPQDYIYATLTDETPQFDAMNHLRSYYPNIMKLDYENSRTRAIREGGVPTALHKSSFEEIMENFYTEMIGTRMTEEEKQILKETAKEAGVIE